jgi:hypothetical protein
VPGQSLPRQTDQPGIDHRIGPIARNASLQQSRSPESAHQRTAGFVDLIAVRIAEIGGKRVERRSVIVMAGIEEWPREVLARGTVWLPNRSHVQSPAKTGFAHSAGRNAHQ